MALPPPPALTDDLVREILLRLPPDEPACLFRASLVCKRWLSALSDPAFLHRYRTHHRAPPLLGFIHNRIYPDEPSPCFVSTADKSPFPPPQFDCRKWAVLDCRHGRALVHTLEPHGLIVWDPITGDHHHLPPVPPNPYSHLTAAVLCSVDGCDHLDCRNGPFRVVFVGAAGKEYGDDEGSTWASVYTSETGAWAAPTTFLLGPIMKSRHELGPTLLAGDALYFLIEDGNAIIKYELGGGELSGINGPDLTLGNMVLMTAEDGGLGVAGVEDYSLRLWSWRDGAEPGWARGRVIELDMMISITIGDPETNIHVGGFAEGADTFFISADAGVFTVELKSGRVRPVGDRGNFDAIFSYVGFCTPDYAIATTSEDALIDPST